MNADISPELKLQLALYRLRLARMQAQRAIIVATLAMHEACRKQQQRSEAVRKVIDARLTEMMQEHDRMDA